MVCENTPRNSAAPHLNAVCAAERKKLLSRDYIHALAQALCVLDLPRRDVPNWLAETLYGWTEHGGIALQGDGTVLEIHDTIVDDIHGNDPAYTWVSAVRWFAKRRPKRKPRQSLELRLTIYDLAFKICGRPVLEEDRGAEVTSVRKVLREMSPVTRVRYVHAMRQLRRAYGEDSNPMVFARDVRKLRLRLAKERRHWLSQ